MWVDYNLRCCYYVHSFSISGLIQSSMTGCQIQFCRSSLLHGWAPPSGSDIWGKTWKRQGRDSSTDLGRGVPGRGKSESSSPRAFENDIKAKRVRADDAHFSRGLIKQVRTSEAKSKQWASISLGLSDSVLLTWNSLFCPQFALKCYSSFKNQLKFLPRAVPALVLHNLCHAPVVSTRFHLVL